MKLAEQIEAMRQRMVEEHSFSMNQLEHLEKRMLVGDAEIMQKIESIKSMQTRNATDIVRALLTVANRVGYLPSPATVAPPPIPQRGQAAGLEGGALNAATAATAMDAIIDQSGAVH